MRAAPHNHITQVAEPLPGCPACDLIRPEAMDRLPLGAFSLLGPLRPRPESTV